MSLFQQNRFHVRRPEIWLILPAIAGVVALAGQGPSAASDQPPALAPLPRPDPFDKWLDRDGNLNYVERLNALVGREVKPQNNALVLLWQVMGPAPEGGNPMPLQYFRYLQAPRPVKGQWQKLFDYLVQNCGIQRVVAANLHDRLLDYYRRPWTNKEQPLLAAWLESNKEAMDLIAKAVLRQRYFNPAYDLDDNGEPVDLTDNLLPHAQMLREINQAFLIRAMLKLKSGDTAGAWQDILTTYRLARQLSQGTWFIEGLVGATSEFRAFDTVSIFFDSIEPAPRQLQQFLRDLRQLPEPSWLIDSGITPELVVSLTCLQELHRQWRKQEAPAYDFIQQMVPLKDEVAGVLELVTDELWVDAQRRLIGWAVQLDGLLRSHYSLGHSAAEIDRFFATLRQSVEVDARSIQTHAAAWKQNPKDFGPERRQEFRTRLSRLLSYTVGVRRDFIILSAPVLSKLDGIHWRRRQMMELLQLRLGLELYRCEQGRYPQRLGELAAKYFEEIPPDRFRPAPLVYSVGDQWVLLYSVGLNGQDDGGRSHHANPPGDDIVVSFRPPLPPGSQDRKKE